MSTKTTLIKEYISILLEDDGGGFGGFGDFGGMGMGGMGMGGLGIGDDAIYRTFVSGWVDLFKTAKSAGTSIIGSSYTVAKVILNAIIDMVIPFYRNRYKEIIERHNQVQDKIHNEYSRTYDSIAQALVNNDDFLVSAFMYDPAKFFNTTLQNPSAFVTGVGILKSPDVIADTFNVLSGGGSSLGPVLKKAYGDSDWQKITSALKGGLSASSFAKIMGSTSESKRWNKTTLLEVEGKELSDEEKAIRTKKAENAIKILLNPKVVKQILNSDEIKDMVKTQRAAVNNTLNDIVNEVKKAMSIKSFDDIERLTGKKIEKADDISEELEAQFVNETKQSIKAMYVKMLSADAKILLKDLPKDHEMVKAYMNAINAVKSA